MIRLKHKIYPVWIEWEGEAETFKNAQTHVIEDIKLNGFGHFNAFEDITDEQSENQKYWHPENNKQVTKDTSQLLGQKIEPSGTTDESTDEPQEKVAEEVESAPVKKNKSNKRSKKSSLSSLKSATARKVKETNTESATEQQ